ncbi:MAG: AMP-binding protein [Thermoplasmata archaeon]
MIIDISGFLARSYGSRIALEDYGGETYSFERVDQIANSFAFELLKKGVRPGDLISVFSQNKSLEVILFFAALKLKATLVPHNIRLSKDEILREVELVKPKVAIFSNDLPIDIKNIEMDINKQIIYLEELPTETKYKLDTLDSDLETTALIIFTGGTTGEPKGAKIPLRSIIFNAVNTIITWKLSKDDVSLLAYPLYHTGGWNVLTLPLFLCGGSSILIQKFKPDLIAEILQKKNVTVFSTVPAVLLEISELNNFPDLKFPSLRFIKSGGGMSSPKVIESFLSKNIKFYQGYGLTEAGPNIFYSDEEDLKKEMSIGKKSIFVDLKLIDENNKESNKGELWVGGPIIFSGYLDKNQDETILEKGYVKTGDILERDNDGHYYFVGRKKFMYKSGGENIYPTEIENVIEKHPDVIECAVIGVPDEKWGEVGMAFVVTRKNISEEDLKSFAIKYLAKYKIPKYFIFVNSIPRTPAGKKDYIKLREGKYYEKFESRR